MNLAAIPVGKTQDRSTALKTLSIMYLTRMMDDKMGKLVRQNKGTSFHMAVSGHEMIGAVTGLSLLAGTDWAFPYYRDRAFVLGLGCLPQEIFAAFLARTSLHHSGGRMMPEHFSHRDLRIPCQSSCVGSQFLQAVGCAQAIQFQNKSEIVYVSGGDGSTSQGDFHEALNYSCLKKLPIVFVIQDNGWAISVPVEDQTAGGSVAKMAQGYEGLCVFEFDGGHYPAVQNTVQQAIRRGRDRLGPSLLVAKVPRLCPHSSSDDPKKYREEAEIALEKLRDPIPRFEKWLVESNLLLLQELETLKAECFAQVEQAALLADSVKFPDTSSATSGVFLPYEPSFKTSSSPKQEAIVVMDALNHALIEEMERDEGVVVFGQDVAGGKGGVFGITRTLTERFGSTRCFNTPLAESTIIGLAIGLALEGNHRPVAEIQFADYSWTAMNQLVNELASICYRSDGKWHCPVVVRMPCGGYIQGGPYHSQSIEAIFCHSPGLKVVIPSNAADAKRLLKTAIRDPNPVIFLEHKALYRQRVFCARAEPGSDQLLPFGKAKIVREGKDVTVVAWGMMVIFASEIAETLHKEGIEVEVIDLRTLVPLDFDTVLRSLQKTARVLITHEAPRTCGFGAELAARIVEEGFSLLDAPVVRVAAKDCPVPYCKNLEDVVLPQKQDLEKALRQLLTF